LAGENLLQASVNIQADSWLLHRFEGGFVFMGPSFPSQLTLSRKLTEPEPVQPEDTLLQHITSRGDVATFAKKLTVTQKMSMLFPGHALQDHVHILVQIPSTSEPVACLVI